MRVTLWKLSVIKMGNGETTFLPIVVAVVAIIIAFSLGLYSVIQNGFMNNFEELTFSVLALVVEFMNLIGGFLILFGAILLSARYVRAKLKAPTVPFSGVSPRLTFLTLGLEIFIGAEIINTAITRTLDDFLLLSLTIATRGVIGLILYLEKKWGSCEV